MSKQLRLDVAQLTDVGRKRPHNEDNMAYVIPRDPQMMAKKGALFIVADGMGGHAAGEVASEIAVDTVSKVYYQDDRDDVVESLIHAIKRANTLIHQRAAENMLRSGMGTTCVAAVLRGSTAYIANVGDSRAYMFRNGQGKQVSQDHSWVEEQVRAGLLTQDQARSHAQRNVITRSLGTSPDVEVDVFTEHLEPGDSFILCSDGLSNMVEDEEISAIISQFMPREGVYRLVERANANGGTDNITAIVIRIQEVGWEPTGSQVATLSPNGTRNLADENTVPFGPYSGSTLVMPHPNEGTPAPSVSAPLPMPGAPPSGPLASPDLATIPQPTFPSGTPQAPKKNRRLLFPALALIILLVVTLAGSGAYYLFFMNRANPDVDKQLTQARSTIDQTKALVQSNPGKALQDLANVQKTLKPLHSASLNDEQRSKLSGLDTDLTTNVKTAIQNYNKNSSILPLCSTTPNKAITGNPQITAITAAQQGNTRFFYALGSDKAVYLLNDKMSPATKITAFDGDVLAIEGNNGSLAALYSKAGQNNAPATYSIAVGLITASGSLEPPQIDEDILKTLQVKDFKPTQLAAADDTYYVLLTSTTNANTNRLLRYEMKNNTLQAPDSTEFTISSGVKDIVAFPKSDQIFFLLNNGEIQSVNFTQDKVSPTSVITQKPIYAPLSLSATEFTTSATVPTPPESSMTQTPATLSIPDATALATGTVNNTPHLYIADNHFHRVLDLTAVSQSNGTPPTNANGGAATNQVKVQLERQFAAGNQLSNVLGITADPGGKGFHLLGQNASNNATTLFSVDTQKPNTCPA